MTFVASGPLGVISQPDRFAELLGLRQAQIPMPHLMSLQAVVRGCRVRRSLFEQHVLAPILAAGLQKKHALQQARQVDTIHNCHQVGLALLHGCLAWRVTWILHAAVALRTTA